MYAKREANEPQTNQLIYKGGKAVSLFLFPALRLGRVDNLENNGNSNRKTSATEEAPAEILRGIREETFTLPSPWKVVSSDCLKE